MLSQGNKEESTEGELESMEPQAIIAFVAATYVNSLPLDLILTDGEQKTLLRFKGKEILIHSNLPRRVVRPNGLWRAHCFELLIMTLILKSRSCWLILPPPTRWHYMVHCYKG